VVMMLACDAFKVALVTTHMPLSAVSSAITVPLIIDVIRQLNGALKSDFAIQKPSILVAGLNPHAGESGYLGREEIDVIEPAIQLLQKEGVHVTGPFSADTLFSKENIDNCDVFVTMYHDQGLPVLKYAGFGSAVNITLGLPIIRTSVDHGTALNLAGKQSASASSLIKAVNLAATMAKNRV
jgi:4-hydroxythreonine-4-phosphate dehydrogenase